MNRTILYAKVCCALAADTSTGFRFLAYLCVSLKVWFDGCYLVVPLSFFSCAYRSSQTVEAPVLATCVLVGGFLSAMVQRWVQDGMSCLLASVWLGGYGVQRRHLYHHL